MDFPTLQTLRRRRHLNWVRAVALGVLVAWLCSLFYLNCSRPAHTAMADCAQEAAGTDGAKPAPDDCGDDLCYTAGEKDQVLTERLKSALDFPSGVWALFWVVLLLDPPGPARFRAAGGCPRGPRVPLIYQFCSLRN
ncbi:hypothetical protein [Candidatus Methylocalor cossyra]|uniref:Uncharacterized protein n=1 Tax=Candidatus Methylocalor cossyra TaxID=3108543 RepID=A0ABM9NLK2_9GAMM